jgi:hypothetical protein
MIALSAGVAYQYSGNLVNAFVNRSLLQAASVIMDTVGSIKEAIAWRAVSSCTTPYNKHNFKGGDREKGLIAPTAIIAIHDLFN